MLQDTLVEEQWKSAASTVAGPQALVGLKEGFLNVYPIQGSCVH